ncbi:MAG TPA: hypothetical protein VND64_30530 [Pirellulales bacterium]|nr:hypothetical protein [Pirellulales bacterium]
MLDSWSSLGPAAADEAPEDGDAPDDELAALVIEGAGDCQVADLVSATDEPLPVESGVETGAGSCAADAVGGAASWLAPESNCRSSRSSMLSGRLSMKRSFALIELNEMSKGTLVVPSG